MSTGFTLFFHFQQIHQNPDKFFVTPYFQKAQAAEAGRVGRSGGSISTFNIKRTARKILQAARFLKYGSVMI